MVQPFAESFAKKEEKIYLCMKEMNSKHFAEQVPAIHFSVDGAEWDVVPKGIRVLGSRYALAIKALRKEEFNLPLNQSHVIQSVATKLQHE